jgi:hypothetical protein
MHPRAATSHAAQTQFPYQDGLRPATHPATPDLTSLLKRAPVPPSVSWPRTLPPYRGGLRHCRVSHGSRPRLPTKEGSGVTTCPTALDPASQRGRALALPRIP